MKIRNGFVSNSSSSSYVLVLREQNCKELMEKVSPLVEYLIEQIGGWQDKKLGEDSVKVLSWWSGNISSFEYIDSPSDELIQQYKENCKTEDVDNEMDEEEIIYDCWEQFRELAEKQGLLLYNSDS